MTRRTEEFERALGLGGDEPDRFLFGLIDRTLAQRHELQGRLRRIQRLLVALVLIALGLSIWTILLQSKANTLSTRIQESRVLGSREQCNEQREHAEGAEAVINHVYVLALAKTHTAAARKKVEKEDKVGVREFDALIVALTPATSAQECRRRADRLAALR